MDWRQQTEELFFKQKINTAEIAKQTGKTRKYISAYLNSHPAYAEEKKKRKEENQEKRKERQKEWDRTCRVRQGDGDRAMLLNDHIQAVRELSHEKYY